MENLNKSKWLVFSFFRLAFQFINEFIIQSRIDLNELKSKVSSLEAERLEHLNLIADLTDRVNNVSTTFEEALPALTADQKNPKSMVRHPTELMDSIYSAYMTKKDEN